MDLIKNKKWQKKEIKRDNGPPVCEPDMKSLNYKISVLKLYPYILFALLIHLYVCIYIGGCHAYPTLSSTCNNIYSLRIETER